MRRWYDVVELYYRGALHAGASYFPDRRVTRPPGSRGEVRRVREWVMTRGNGLCPSGKVQNRLELTDVREASRETQSCSFCARHYNGCEHMRAVEDETAMHGRSIFGWTADPGREALGRRIHVDLNIVKIEKAVRPRIPSFIERLLRAERDERPVDAHR